MSGLVKSVKKVFKKVGKVVKKIVKSKAFKFVVAAAAIYFGGAGIASMMKGGSFMTGVSSAAGTLSSAGSSLMAGEFGTAASSIGNAWGTAATAGANQAALNATISTGLSSGVGNAGLNAQGNLVAGSANTGTTLTSANGTSIGLGQGQGLMGASPQVAPSVAAPTGGSSLAQNLSNTVGGTSTNTGGTLINPEWQAMVDNVGDPTLLNTSTKAIANEGIKEAAMSYGEGLMWSAGINAGTQAVGGYLNAKAQEDMLEDERKEREKNMLGKRYGSDFQYNIKSAFTPSTVTKLRGA